MSNLRRYWDWYKKHGRWQREVTRSLIWVKFIGWSSSSSVICAHCNSFGEFQSNPAFIQLFPDAATETFRVGRASGADLPNDLVEKLGKVLGVDTPVNLTLYNRLSPHIDG